MADLEKTIMLGDFGSVENKELFEKAIFAEIKPKIHSWRKRAYAVDLPAPYKSKSFRSVAFPKPATPNTYKLVEGVVPDPTGKLTFIEETMAVESYGFYETYTDQDMVFGFDAIQPRLQKSVVHQATYMTEEMTALAFLSGNNVYDASNGLTREDFIKIRISLKKFSRKDNPKVIAVLTPEDIADLRLKYNNASSNLLLDIPANEQSIVEGALYKFEGVYIEEDDSPQLYNDDGTRRGIFYTTDSEGRSPVAYITTDGKNAEFIAKGLGSAGTSDPLNQTGSVGVKFMGLGNKITAEECLVRVEIGSVNIATVDSDYDDNGKAHAFGKAIDRNESALETSPKKVLSVSASLGTIKVGKTTTIKAYGVDSKDVSITLESGDISIATVSDSVVTGVKAGLVSITVKASDYLDSKIAIKVVD